MLKLNSALEDAPSSPLASAAIQRTAWPWQTQLPLLGNLLAPGPLLIARKLFFSKKNCLSCNLHPVV